MSEVMVVPLVQNVLREQDAYRQSPPSIFPRAVRRISGPVGLLTHHLIPAEAIEAAIRGVDWAASNSIRKSAISHDFSDLEACEASTTEVRRWALGYAITGGGAAGAFGVFGLVADVPATVALALRTTRLIGLCYGFGANTEAERTHILDILQLAGANSTEQREEAIQRLAEGRAAMDQEDWQKIAHLAGQTTGSVAATKRVATTLGVNLSTRKLGQIAPVIGAAVGAGVNAAFQTDVADAAQFAYRARWLEVNERILDGAAH